MTEADGGPSEPDITKNAEAAAAEIRAQIDHQVATATATDTKAAFLLSAELGLAGLVASRVYLDTPERLIAGLIALVALIAVAGPAALALRPRLGFSFGADASSLVAELERYPRVAIALSLAESLAKARDRNAKALDEKQTRYEVGLLALFVLLPAIALMVATGAIR